MDDFSYSHISTDDWQTQNEEFNDELFLKHICNYPVIYDLTRKAYSNRLLTDKAWDNISKSMMVSVETCKKRWKSLREKYNREKQKLDNLSRSEAGAFYTTPWPHMSFFQFMYDSRQPRETISSALGESQQDNATSGNQNNYYEDMQPENISEDSSYAETTNDTFHLASPKTNRLKTFGISTNINSQSKTYDFVTGNPSESETSRLPKRQDIENNPSGSGASGPPKRQDIENNPSGSGASGPPKRLPKNVNPLTEIPKPPKTRKKNVIDEVGGSAEDPMVGVLEKISSSMQQVIGATEDKLNTFSSYVVAEVRDLPLPIQEEFMNETIIRLLQIKRRHRKT